MSSNRIVQLATPTSNDEAATKEYVDAIDTKIDNIPSVIDTKINTLPIVIPITVSISVPRKQAYIYVTGINLNIILDDSRQVVVVFNYHPFVKQIEKEVTGGRGVINKLRLIITVHHTQQIGEINLHGIIAVMRGYTTDSINNGGKLTTAPLPGETQTRAALTAARNERVMLVRQWRAYDSVFTSGQLSPGHNILLG